MENKREMSWNLNVSVGHIQHFIISTIWTMKMCLGIFLLSPSIID